MNRLSKKIPNPGSKDAIKAGCECPIIDNSYGRGYMGQKNVFIYSIDCIVHNQPEEEENEKRHGSK